jgi:hypothetical protein
VVGIIVVGWCGFAEKGRVKARAKASAKDVNHR